MQFKLFIKNRKFPKWMYMYTLKIVVITLTFEQCGSTIELWVQTIQMECKQCRPWSDWAVWSGSILFAQAYLSENFGSLRYRVRCLADKITCHILNIMVWKLIPKRHQEVWLKIATKENYAQILLWRMYIYKPDFPFLWLLSKWKPVKERHIMGQAPSLL